MTRHTGHCYQAIHHFSPTSGITFLWAYVTAVSFSVGQDQNENPESQCTQSLKEFILLEISMFFFIEKCELRELEK